MMINDKIDDHMNMNINIKMYVVNHMNRLLDTNNNNTMMYSSYDQYWNSYDSYDPENVNAYHSSY